MRMTPKTLSIVCMFVLFSPSASATDLSWFFRDYQWAMTGIVSVKLEQDGAMTLLDRHGTGFFVDDKCTVVTALHVVSGIPSENLYVRLRLPREPNRVNQFPATIIHSSRDLAFLRVRLPGKPRCTTGDVRPLKLARPTEAVTFPGEEVFIAGFPRLAASSFDIPVVRDGVIGATEVSWADGPMLLLDLIGVPGFSGAPVVHKDSGRVVGVVFGPGMTERQFGMEWASPVSTAEYDAAIAAETATNDK
jgi:trypsin-like peptidase